MLKKRLSAEEKYGLTGDQIVEAEKYLRQYKTAGAINKQEAIPIYEMYLLGYSFDELAAKFPKYSRSKITLTAALHGWAKDRDKLASSIYDRIKTRIVRSTVEQVEFLTDMISVSSVENSEEMRKYLEDPKKNPLPAMRIKSFKEYQQVIEMLSKVTESVRSFSNASAKENEQEKPQRVQATGKKAISAASEESILLEQLVQVNHDE